MLTLMVFHRGIIYRTNRSQSRTFFASQSSSGNCFLTNKIEMGSRESLSDEMHEIWDVVRANDPYELRDPSVKGE
jgi:hypothetical protein